MKEKVVVFDVDGTLFDTKRGIIDALNCMLRSYGEEPIEESEENKYIGPSIKESLVRLHGFDEKKACEGTELYRKIYVEQFIGKSVAYQGMEKMLIKLKETGCILGIATMKTRPQIDRLMDLFNLGTYFSVIKTAREDGSLNKEQMLKQIKKMYGERCLYYMVGDTLGDYLASEGASYEFIATDYGYGNVKELDCRHIKRLEELVGILELV